MTILKIALKNLTRQKKRSGLLAAAIAFAFFAVVFLDGMATGALTAMSGEIAKIFGGHVYIVGAQKDSDKADDDRAKLIMDKESIDFVKQIIKDLNIKTKYEVHRIRGNGGRLIFEGKEPVFTQVDGVRFDEEQLLRDSILFKEGSWEDMKQENAILISENVAESLDVKFNDIILVEAENLLGQLTVEECQIKGIAVDASAFSGLNSYINYEYAQKIFSIDKDMETVYGFLLENADVQDKAAERIEQALRKKNAVTVSRTEAKKENPNNPADALLVKLNNGKWEGTKFAVATFNDFAPQLGELMFWIKLISLGILVVLLIITMIGISNTFKIIVHERRGEIGTMRSCGIKKRHVRVLFIAEAMFLSLVGAVAGSVFAIIIMQIFTLIPISKESFFAAFTSNGHFMWNFSYIALSIEILVVLLLTILTVVSSASKAANMVPAEALRSGK